VVAGIEPVLALKWLYGLLTPDPVLSHPVTGVKEWHEVAPSGVKSPFGIVRQLTGSEDLLALAFDGPNERIWVPVIMQVIIYDRVAQNYSRVEPLAARAYTLLHRASDTLPFGIIYASRRTLVRSGTDAVGDAVERFIEQQFTLDALST
jgi:hypothetical protein